MDIDTSDPTLPERAGPEPVSTYPRALHPFRWLSRTQLLSAAGDTLVAIALAGSLFFDIDPSAARWRVGAYLLLTMAPFALVGPLIGPLIDRMTNGRRAMIVGTAIGRAVLALMMARDLNSLFLFPQAFGSLVLSKTYHVSKSAIVPGMVTHDGHLVEANSKLVLVSGIGGALAVGPGLLLGLAGSGWVLVFAAVVFALSALPAMRLHGNEPGLRGGSAPARPRSFGGGGVVLAASAMAVLRGIAGFTLFLLAFWLRGEEAEPWWFGVVLAAFGVGALLGAALAGMVRSVVREELLLIAMLSLTAVAAAFAVFAGGDQTIVAALAFVIGFGGAVGKVSFDAITQRDAPPADQGRAFARFETRFQLAWVVGAALPVVLPSGVLPLRAGMVALFVVASVGGALYSAGLWALARGRRPPGEIVATRARRAAKGTLRRAVSRANRQR